MRLASTALYNIRLQFRHGFYYAYIVVCAVYVVLLRLLPEDLRELLTPVFIFTDPAMLGIFFVGGIVLLEQNDNTLQSLFVTPLRRSEYCLAKVFSLALLALSTSVLLAVASRAGIAFNLLPLILGVLLTSSLVTLAGLAVVSRSETVIGYIFVATPILVVMVLPLLDYFAVAESSWFYVVPTHASIKLIAAAFEPTAEVAAGTGAAAANAGAAGGAATAAAAGAANGGSIPPEAEATATLQPAGAETWELLLSVGLLIFWNIAAWRWAQRWFERYALGLTKEADRRSPERGRERGLWHKSNRESGHPRDGAAR